MIPSSPIWICEFQTRAWVNVHESCTSRLACSKVTTIAPTRQGTSSTKMHRSRLCKSEVFGSVYNKCLSMSRGWCLTDLDPTPIALVERVDN